MNGKLKNGLGNGDSWDGEIGSSVRPKKGQASRIVQERDAKYERGLGARSVEDFDLGKAFISSI